MQTFRLGSSPMVSAPGIIAWAMNGYAFPGDDLNTDYFVKLIADTWSVPEVASEALLSGRAPFTVDGEVVVFSAEAV